MELRQLAGEKEVINDVHAGANYSATDISADLQNRNIPLAQYTVSDAIEQLGFGKFQLKLLLKLSFCFASDGLEVLLLSIIGPVLRCQWHLSKVQMAFITTTVFWGMITSSNFIGWMFDKYGRRRSLLVVLAWGAFCSILSAFSPNYTWILLLRFCVGTSLPSIGQVYVYSQEYLPKAKRRYALVLDTVWTVGALFAVSLGLLMFKQLNLKWNWYILILSVPLVISTLLVYTMPESVRYLVENAQMNKVNVILAAISKENQTPLPKGKLVAEKSKLAQAKFLSLFQPDYRKSTLMLMFIFLIAGFSYYGIILITTQYFSSPANKCLHPEKVVNVDLSSCLHCIPLTVQNYIELIWTTFAETPGILITFLLFEKIGRKKTLAIDFLLAALCMCPLFFCLRRTISVVLLFIARAAIMGAFCGVQVYGAEVYPTPFRSTSCGLLSFFARLGGMITPFFSQVSIEFSIPATISVYAILMLTSALLCLWLPVETRGRQLDDKDD